MPKPSKDDVERLSRGMPTRAKIGSRNTGHRLTQKERILCGGTEAGISQVARHWNSLKCSQRVSTVV